MLRKLLQWIGCVVLLVLCVGLKAQEADVRIAGVVDDKLQLYTGSDELTLISDSPTFFYNPIWSADGALLAYTVRVNEFDPTDYISEFLGGTGKVFVYDGATSTEIASDILTPFVPIAWSGDDILYPVMDNESLMTALFQAAAERNGSFQSEWDSLMVFCGSGGTTDPRTIPDMEESGYFQPTFAETAYGLVFVECETRGLYLKKSAFESPVSIPSLMMTGLVVPQSIFDFALAADGKTIAQAFYNEALKVVQLSLFDLSNYAATTLPVTIELIDGFAAGLHLAWSEDGNLYYSMRAVSGNLLDGATEEQIAIMDDLFGLSNPPEFLGFEVSLHRIDREGSDTLLYSGDAYSIGRIQVVGETLYFSQIVQDETWIEDMFSGEITSETLFTSAPQYLSTDLYALALAEPNAVPTLIGENFRQFAVAPDSS